MAMARSLLVDADMVAHRRSQLSLIAIITVTLFHASGRASADPPPEPPYPAQPQLPPGYPPPPPGYVAPLSQQTQPSYVPQSVALSGPERIVDLDESRPPPPGYTSVLVTRKGPLIGGAVTFGVSYGISALTAAVGEDSKGDGDNEVAALWIPVAGPFLQIFDTESATAKVFLVGLGGAQLAGAIMLYTGLTTKRRIFVRNDLIGSATVAPMVGNGASGMVLTGRF
jgi:hypothetical protein